MLPSCLPGLQSSAQLDPSSLGSSRCVLPLLSECVGDVSKVEVSGTVAHWDFDS